MKMFNEIIEKAAKELNVVCLYGEEIKPGDMYLACRNTGPKFLECKSVNKLSGIVFPTTIDYPFNTYECVKVMEK